MPAKSRAAPETVTVCFESAGGKTLTFRVRRTLPERMMPDRLVQLMNYTGHPPIDDMVEDAVRSLKDRKGSSLKAIKKYIAATYDVVDMDKITPQIKDYLNLAVEIGELDRTRGKGAAGFFKLAASATKSKRARCKKTKSKPKAADKPVKNVGTSSSEVEAPAKAKTAAAVKKTVSTAKEVSKK